MDRGDLHTNKTVENFINEFELEVKSFMLSVDTDNPDRLIGVVFFPYDIKEVARRNHYQQETNAVRLYFSDSMEAATMLKNADKAGKNSWNKNIYNKIKNQKIKLTRCLIYHYSPYRVKYKDKLNM